MQSAQASPVYKTIVGQIAHLASNAQYQVSFQDRFLPYSLPIKKQTDFN